MRGSIDQVEAVIHFDDDTEELQQWDQQVSSAVQYVNSVVLCHGNMHKTELHACTRHSLPPGLDTKPINYYWS